MAVSAVQNDNKTRKVSYVGSVLVGGLGGYSVKWALPITSQEKDERFRAGLRNIVLNSRLARNEEIKTLRSSKVAGADEFIKLYDSNKLNPIELKKLDLSLQENIRAINEVIIDKVNRVKAIGKSELINNIKGIRPTGTFLILGIVSALGFAFARNVSEIAKNEDFSDID